MLYHILSEKLVGNRSIILWQRGHYRYEVEIRNLGTWALFNTSYEEAIEKLNSIKENYEIIYQQGNNRLAMRTSRIDQAGIQSTVESRCVDVV